MVQHVGLSGCDYVAAVLKGEPVKRPYLQKLVIRDWYRCEHGRTICTACAYGWRWDHNLLFDRTVGGREMLAQMASGIYPIDLSQDLKRSTLDHTVLKYWWPVLTTGNGMVQLSLAEFKQLRAEWRKLLAVTRQERRLTVASETSIPILSVAEQADRNAQHDPPGYLVCS